MKRFFKMITLVVLIFILIFYGFGKIYTKETVHMELTEQDSLIYLKIQNGTRIKGWDKDDIIYFFMPSYVEAKRIIMKDNRHYSVSNNNQIRYNEIQKLLKYDEQGNIIGTKDICFKHSANIYTMYIDLEEDITSIVKEDFVQAKLSVINPQGDIEYGRAGTQIKGRGNSTWSLDKKPYYIKFPKKVPLCGMDPSKKWLLIANGYEGTKILNKMLYEFASEIGLDYCSESEWVDLYINGEYRGNYLLCEKIEVDENRVNITNLEKENEILYGRNECEYYTDDYIKGFLTNVNPDNITGGYIIEKDFYAYWADEMCGFQTINENYFSITSPDNASVEEVKYIRDVFENIDYLLEMGSDEVLQYIDMESFVRRFLFEEIVLNSDAYITSCYYYKKQDDDKIYAGPVWDCDGTLGESNGDWLNYDQRTVLNMEDYRGSGAALGWEPLLYEIEEYRDCMQNAYADILPKAQNLIDIGIDEYIQTVGQSVEMDSIRWDYGADTAGHYKSLDNNIRFIKFFLVQRINFINRRFGMAELVYDFTNGSTHTITCIGENETISWVVEDGEFLHYEDLPMVDENKYSGWIYERDKQQVSSSLPVYEDIVLELEEL